MFGRMDRYVAGAVGEAYFATGAAFFTIAVLFDLLVNLGKYARQAREVLQIDLTGLLPILGEYYACWLPVLYLMFAPYVCVIACMFGVTKLTTANEMLPMLFCGRSMSRILRPVLGVAVLSGLGMAAVWQWVGPLVIDRYQVLKDMLEEQRIDDASKNVLVRSGAHNEDLLCCARYRPSERVMERVVVLERPVPTDGGDGAGMAIVRAASGRWDEARGVWLLTEGWRQAGNRKVPVAELSLPGVVPDVVRRLSRGANPEYVQMLSFTELHLLRGLRPGRHDLILAYHLHFATPLSCLILVLLTLTLAVQFERGSRVGRVIVAFFVCVAFLVFDLACRNLGLRQFVHPVVAAWTPVIVFGSLGVLSYSGIRT
jgi:lipopolysaccharide export system permease protein